MKNNYIIKREIDLFKEFKTRLFGTVLLVFVAGTMFDLIVTYTVFKWVPAFQYLENNKEFVKFLLDGTLPKASIITHYLFASIALIGYTLSMMWNKFDMIFIYLSLPALVLGSNHFFGGMTWLIRSVN